MTSTPIVSVVVPAHNAQRWIEEAIRSAQNQTVSLIEIIVVVDGSTDDTLRICEEMSAKDPRVRVLTIDHGGVARARNIGVAAALGEFIAPLDADDLWHPSRLERHVTALRCRSLDFAVAFSPSVSVDEESVGIALSPVVACDGFVFAEHLCFNFIGNGSGMTVRTAAMRAVGGYSERLRASGAEGAEDYLVQLRLAYKFKFVCVAEYLIGYRTSPGNMSSDRVRMGNSLLLALDDIEVFATGVPPALFYFPRAQAAWVLAFRYFEQHQFRMCFAACLQEACRNPMMLPYMPFAWLGRFLSFGKRFLPPPPKVPFTQGSFIAAPRRPLPWSTRLPMSVYRHFERFLANREPPAHHRQHCSIPDHGDEK